MLSKRTFRQNVKMIPGDEMTDGGWSPRDIPWTFSKCRPHTVKLCSKFSEILQVLQGFVLCFGRLNQFLWKWHSSVCLCEPLTSISRLTVARHSGRELAPRLWGRSFKFRQYLISIVWTKIPNSVLICQWRILIIKFSVEYFSIIKKIYCIYV